MVFVIFLEKNGKRYYQKKRFVPRAECAGDLMPVNTITNTLLEIAGFAVI